MSSAIKKSLYFVVAAYFAFWARIVLWRWRPRIVVITGSSGKTTLLHLVEAQLGDRVIYSHHANSAIGLPFHILGLDTNVEVKWRWLAHMLRAPIKAFRKVPDRKIYITEVDTDRPREGKFLAGLLKPEVTLWISVYNTHSMNFDELVHSGAFKNHRSAIAYEFGHLIENTTKLVVVNSDQAEIIQQLDRVPKNTKVEQASVKKIARYQFGIDKTVYQLDEQNISVPGLHPKELGVSLQLVNKLLEYLNEPLDNDYSKLVMPPGRTNIFKGIRGITIVDSTYNTGLGAMTVILKLFNGLQAKNKWLIFGDILEQGSIEQDQHEKLAKVISDMKVDRVVLLGPRTKKHTYPLLKQKLSVPVVSFESPKEVLDYLLENLRGGETLLFKGGRFLEGVIEQLLTNPAQAKELVRREKLWVKRRQKWGLPR